MTSRKLEQAGRQLEFLCEILKAHNDATSAYVSAFLGVVLDDLREREPINRSIGAVYQRSVLL